MSVILKTPDFRSDQFTWDPTSCWLIAEASDLTWRNGFRRIYDDACDVGIAIESVVTGLVAVFHLAEEKRDADGDVTVWIFRPTAETQRNPRFGTRVAEIHILND